MTNSVFLIGTLGKKYKGNMRILYCVRESSGEKQFSNDIFYIKHWTGDKNAKILTLDCGIVVAISGRIETAEGLGAILVVEDHQVLKLSR